MEKKALTTADVPARFLQAALLVGHIPLRAVACDPRVSYALYVPPHHYNPSPAQGEDKVPLLVYMHGTRRDISAIHDAHGLVAFAETTPCAVLAPLFPAGLDGANDIDSYKLLRSKTLRSDLVLLSMLDEIAQRWPGVRTEKIFMMGFSGGGQFAHRFLYLYPERLAAVSVGAPGRVTSLDSQKKWPMGVADAEALFGRTVQADLLRKVPIQLVIGSADTVVHGGEEFWVWHREMKARDGSGRVEAGDCENGDLPQMDRGRLESIRGLQAMWKRHGIDSHLDIVPGVAHDDKGVRESVLQFMRPHLQA
ncbi:uncharacterized protein Z519_08097 [Cladophialophora bantiana CBS 173.52]|uniref:Uncharacterized protein n=1 Tax=Cladophialophora bantiana (strain ATCC 10958 / CBS 173.52 / CDC B-1940 / NIH 8579) TaxID=1442370 RepID=A0A0D2EME8_CLAB1|nr:uncharacterized protein Z519_08097 [Cladophialophora bantiana CBS 173.52]KIW91201.1 hypothetical protein Z519_08097 [Cladophialophora bantiana CBS 173.52]